MTAVSGAGVEIGACDGTVTGSPRRWLRLKGATLLVGTLVAFSTTHRSWWLIPLVLLRRWISRRVPNRGEPLQRGARYAVPGSV
jgi:hypothetical protein